MQCDWAYEVRDGVTWALGAWLADLGRESGKERHAEWEARFQSREGLDEPLLGDIGVHWQGLDRGPRKLRSTRQCGLIKLYDSANTLDELESRLLVQSPGGSPAGPASVLRPTATGPLAAEVWSLALG